METDFSFNPEQYDFWSVYETMKKYYPLGIKDPGGIDCLFDQYPGQEAMREIIGENLVEQKNYRERWTKFKNTLKGNLKKPVQSTSILFAPCFSGLVLLKHKKDTEAIHRKELHFAVSLLGPFYTIFGMDSTTILLEREDKPRELFEGEDARQYFEAVHAVTVSPYKEYEAPFLRLQQNITERFEGYKFVPYAINVMKLEGLHISYSSYGDNTDGTIYKALFNHLLDTEVMVRGDSYYGCDEWINNKHHS